jgi:small-conductance mechanosensitive channel
VDLQERYQLEVAARVHEVRVRARPWRSILALIVAIAGAITAEAAGIHRGYSGLAQASVAQRIAFLCGVVAFFTFGMAAAVGLSARVRSSSQQLIGQAHAGVLRYVLVLAGVFAVVTGTLAILQIDVHSLLVGGAVTGVLLGIAAQQSLANLFAGLVLLFARPFRVGDRARFRAGALSGEIEGRVVDISLTYVRLETQAGPMLLPNSQALAAAVMIFPEPAAGGPAAAPGEAAPKDRGPVV